MRLIGKRNYRILFAGIVVLLAAPVGLACDCGLTDASKPFKQVVSQARNKSIAVFSGTVVTIDRKPGDLYVAVRFRITEIWKGSLSDEVTVFTGQGGGDCGYKFEVGQQYLVYAYRYNRTKLGTNICQRTESLLGATQDLRVLG